MMLRTSAPIPAVERIRPRQSMGGVDGSLEVGTALPTKAATTAATGTMNRNTLPHQKCPRSHPPTIGPVATPTPVVAPHRPMAFARSRRSVNTFAISERVDGKIAAAPMPMNARAAINAPGVLAKEPARLPKANTASPRWLRTAAWPPPPPLIKEAVGPPYESLRITVVPPLGRPHQV